MKKQAVLLALWMGIACIAFSGCGQGEPEIVVSVHDSSVSSQSQVFTCAGTWEITGAKRNGIAVDVEPVLEEIGGNIILTLRSDGSAYGQINNASMDGTWAQLENQITQDLSNSETITLEVEEESLLLQQEEDLTLVFEKTE